MSKQWVVYQNRHSCTDGSYLVPFGQTNVSLNPL